MKFETLMLQSLFTACLLICLLTLGSMLIAPANVAKVATSQVAVAAVASVAD